MASQFHIVHSREEQLLDFDVYTTKHSNTEAIFFNRFCNVRTDKREFHEMLVQHINTHQQKQLYLNTWTNVWRALNEIRVEWTFGIDSLCWWLEMLASTSIWWAYENLVKVIQVSKMMVKFGRLLLKIGKEFFFRNLPIFRKFLPNSIQIYSWL